MHVFGQWDKAWVLGEKETNPTQPVSGLVSKTILMWGKGANDCTTNKYRISLTKTGAQTFWMDFYNITYASYAVNWISWYAYCLVND